jgi:hypothetical protein
MVIVYLVRFPVSFGNRLATDGCCVDGKEQGDEFHFYDEDEN